MCGFDCCFFLKIWSLEGGELGWRLSLKSLLLRLCCFSFFYKYANYFLTKMTPSILFEGIGDSRSR